MDIGVITPQLSSYGGSEIYLLECLRRWQESMRITLYTPKFRKRLFREFGINTVNVNILPSARTRDKRLRFFQEIAVMPRVWEQKIENHDLYFLYLFPTHMIRRRPSVWFAAEPLRLLYDLHHYSNDQDAEVSVHLYPKLTYDQMRISDLKILQQIIEKLDVETTFDRLVTNSRTMGGYIENIYGRKPDHVVYPGINLPSEILPPSAFDKILYIGRLWRHKRVELIIKAMALTMPRNDLIIAGDGPEKEKLWHLAGELGIQKSVQFTGDISMEERERLYRECTCCVYTPVREPFGMVPLEAAAAGRPVVATRGGGYGEILKKDAAFFVPAYEGAIAEGIHKLMSNPKRAMAMGRMGRRIVEDYTWDRAANKLAGIFSECVKGPIGARYRRGENPEVVSRIRLGAHYYPWYRAGKRPLHWNENRTYSGVTDFPVSGPYSSHSKAVIRRHLALARRAGLDFFLVNLQANFKGLNPKELEATAKLFDLVEEEDHGIQLAVLLAVNTEDIETAVGAIRRVKDSFLHRSSYVRYKGRSLLWYFMNDAFQGLLFYYYKRIKRLHQGIHPVATGPIAYNKFLPGLLKRFFSGWCFYSPLEVGPREKWDDIWKASYRDLVEDGRELWTFTICPGYDDTHLLAEERKEKRRRRIPRFGLKTYERMQKVALELSPRPDFIVVTSFNEFHENTHIEPSEKFGDRYIRSTSVFKEKLSGHNI